MCQDFCVAMRAKGYPFKFQFPTKLCMVVDLSVLKCDDGAGAIRQRLTSSFDIDHRTPFPPHENLAVNKMALAVWSTALHGLQQLVEELASSATDFLVNNTNNSAHNPSFK